MNSDEIIELKNEPSSSRNQENETYYRRYRKNIQQMMQRRLSNLSINGFMNNICVPTKSKDSKDLKKKDKKSKDKEKDIEQERLKEEKKREKKLKKAIKKEKEHEEEKKDKHKRFESVLRTCMVKDKKYKTAQSQEYQTYDYVSFSQTAEPQTFNQTNNVDQHFSTDDTNQIEQHISTDPYNPVVKLNITQNNALPNNQNYNYENVNFEITKDTTREIKFIDKSTQADPVKQKTKISFKYKNGDKKNDVNFYVNNEKKTHVEKINIPGAPVIKLVVRQNPLYENDSNNPRAEIKIFKVKKNAQNYEPDNLELYGQYTFDLNAIFNKSPKQVLVNDDNCLFQAQIFK
jgi:hypothetical protein